MATFANLPLLHYHYNDVIWVQWHLKSLVSRQFVQHLEQASIKENSDAQHYFTLWWEVPIHGALTRYAKLRVAHAPGMPGTFSLPPTSKETAGQRSRHVSRHVREARAVMHVGIANPRWRGKRSRYSRRMRNPIFLHLVRGTLGWGIGCIVWAYPSTLWQQNPTDQH